MNWFKLMDPFWQVENMGRVNYGPFMGENKVLRKFSCFREVSMELAALHTSSLTAFMLDDYRV